MKAKRNWLKSHLVVLVRSQKEEKILVGCKENLLDISDAGGFNSCEKEGCPTGCNAIAAS